MNGLKNKKNVTDFKKMTHWTANNQKLCRKNIFTASMILYLTKNIGWDHNEWFKEQKNVTDFKKMTNWTVNNRKLSRKKSIQFRLNFKKQLLTSFFKIVELV